MKKEKQIPEMKNDEAGQIQLEEVFMQLEEAVHELEHDNLSLEQSFLVYKKGMDLLKECNDAIDRVEKKVLVLNENGETYEF